MGDVVVLRPRPAEPGWKRSLRDLWSGPWLMSAKGNPYIRIAAGGQGFCVTVFRRPQGGWGWCIATNAGHTPTWSERPHAGEDEARRDAWRALLEFYEGPNESAG